MSSIIFSTLCSIKNDRYHLSIVKIDDDHHQHYKTKTDTSMTCLQFELIDKQRQSIDVPETILLNHLLNVSVQQIRILVNPKRKKVPSSIETFPSNDFSIPLDGISEQTNETTLDFNRSEADLSQRTAGIRRQFILRRYFSPQSITSSNTNLVKKSSIRLSYADASDPIRWTLKRLQLDFDNEDSAKILHKKLNSCLAGLEQRPRRLLVFVNPCCGKGRAQWVYEKKILPIFREANIFVNSIYTERANHAQDYLIHEDLQDYDGLICVGGDGMFAELCHGLFLRTSREAGLNLDDPQVNLSKPALRIGIIPAGSTDAIVFGTTGFNDPVTSALQIIVGESLAIDITTIHNENGFVRFMAAMLAYGFFGDIIQQSDKWRCLGPLRYDLAGFCHFIRNKSYHTDVTITLSSDDSSFSSPSFPSTSINNNTEGKNTSLVTPSLPTIGILPPNSERVTRTARSIFCSRNCQTCGIRERNDLEESRLPLQIRREGHYTTINCLNMSGRCAKSKFGMAPYVHLGDGSCELLLVKRSWRTAFLRFLWQVANDSRSIEDLPNVERYRVSEVHIRPVHTAHRKIGNWACDGELITGQEIHIRVHRQVLNLFASGIHFDQLEYQPVKKNKRTSLCPMFRSKKNKNLLGR